VKTRDGAKLIGISTKKLLRLRREGRILASVSKNRCFCFHMIDLLDLEYALSVEKGRRCE
jgi:hypothetical protein